MVVALAAGLSAWWAVASHSDSGTAALPHGLVAAAGEDRVIVEPDDGMAQIDSLLASPRHWLDLCIYELADPTAESILVADRNRGVAVRVILDRRLEGAQNDAAASYLQSHGVMVHWASDRFFVSHEKAFVIDQRTAVVMSLNLASRYYANTRDAAVVDRDPADVRAIESVFAADFAGRSIRAPTGDDLVWSPDRSEPDIVALIDQATHSILLESEELSSQPVIDALVAAAQRGIAVGIAMTDQTDWHPAFDAITRAGGVVSVLYGEEPVYIHAKILVTDAATATGRALVGSQNLSDTSLTRDRELGVVLTQPALVRQLGRLVESDLARGRRWR